MRLSPFETAAVAMAKAPDGKPCHLWVRPTDGEEIAIEAFSLMPPFNNKDKQWVCVGKIHRFGKATAEQLSNLEDTISFIIENHKSFYYEQPQEL